MLEKVTAFVLRKLPSGSELLLLEHPYAGVQLPAGTVNFGESPAHAVVREVAEETGLKNIPIETNLGSQDTILPPDRAVIIHSTKVFSRPDPGSFDWIQVFPGLLAMIAVFTLITQFESIVPAIGLNTHAGLILVYLGGAMGVNIWLMKGFFDTIPRAIDESAMVDGATHWQTFTQLLLPLMRPILVVIAILTFIGTYGDFILARVLLKSTDQYPLMVGLFIFTSGQFSQKWGPFAAGALLGALPIMLVYLILQDQIVGGLTQGAVKG